MITPVIANASISHFRFRTASALTKSIWIFSSMADPARNYIIFANRPATSARKFSM